MSTITQRKCVNHSKLTPINQRASPKSIAGTATNAITPLTAALMDSAPLDLDGAAAEPEPEAEAVAFPEAEPEPEAE